MAVQEELVINHFLLEMVLYKKSSYLTSVALAETRFKVYKTKGTVVNLLGFQKMSGTSGVVL